MADYDVSKLRDARLAKGWTKRKVAQIVGVDDAIINRVEKGRNQSPETVRKMAEALGVRMKDLIKPEREVTA